MRPSRSVALASPVLAAAATLLTATSSAHAEERRVPEDYPTIQAAIDAAVDGDVVSIAGGAYEESVEITGKSLLVRGAGAESTLWRAPKGHRCLTIPWEGDFAQVTISISGIHFSGFELPYPDAAVDLITRGSTLVYDCAFSDCGWLALKTFAVGARIESCIFEHNFDGPALMVQLPAGTSGVGPTISQCLFADNSRNTGPNAGSAIEVYNTNATITGCRFERNNFPKGNGAAIRVFTGSANISDSFFCESATNPIRGTWFDGGGVEISSDPCPQPPCPADLVTDGSVNGADVAVLLNFWGTDGASYPGVDLDGDGLVGGADLATLLGAWGACPE